MSKSSKYANLTQEEFDIEVDRIFGELNRLEGEFTTEFGNINDLDESVDEMLGSLFDTPPLWVEQLKRTIPSPSEASKDCCVRAKKVFLDIVEEHRHSIKRGLGKTLLESIFPKLLGAKKEKKYEDAVAELKEHINSLSITPSGCQEFGEFLFNTTDNNKENPSHVALEEWAICENEYEETWKDKLSRHRSDTFINTGEILHG